MTNTRASLPLIAETVLQKAALDQGFDIELGERDGWLHFESTQTPVTLALTADDTGGWIAALSSQAVVSELERTERHAPLTLPAGATAAFTVPDATALHALLRRARMLGRSLPMVPLERFTERAAALPRTTEAERLVVQRVGQNIFRDALLEYWNGRCPLTGIDDPALLRASHIKPWADCTDDAERLDTYNGLLLAPHLDAAFDAGLISFDDAGQVIVSPRLSDPNRTRLTLDTLPVLALSPKHKIFMAWHRREVLR
ncbi:MAG: HNH endonuclease [Alphaproteobacteria bacterium]|nr:HNH endonuclease [Alphaproteobacteria bacterium]